MPPTPSASASPQPKGEAPHQTPTPSRSVYSDPLQLGVTIVGVTAAFGGIGWWLDHWLHTFPILMAAGAVLGMFGIIYMTYLRLRAADKAANRTAGPSLPKSDL
jgi:F0F1-type ATP synthase assembly protein I